MNLSHETLLKIISEFKNELSQSSSMSQVLDLKSKFTGKSGQITQLFQGLKDVSLDIKKAFGPELNKIRDEIETLSKLKLNELELKTINENLSKNMIDFSLRSNQFEKAENVGGGLHPLTQTQRQLEDIFLSMGFEILDGPHVEDDYHNFEALNIPANHPARDMQDTFWFADKKHLLRTHTSTIQIRGMKERTPPFRFVGPGKVFRCERTDATHEMVFHQLEGMMVAEKITIGNLIYFMKTLLREIFQQDMEIRLRPGHFPFVEPGFELDIRWKKPDPKDPSKKYSGWLELLPCGMVHPNVLKAGGVDPEKYSGFAFGLGLDRLVMVKYGINDIRLIHGGDLRFLKQFSSH